MEWNLSGITRLSIHTFIDTGDNLGTTPKGSYPTYVHQNIKNASLQET